MTIKGALGIIGKEVFKQFTSSRHAAGYPIKILRVDVDDEDCLLGEPQPPGELDRAKDWVMKNLLDDVRELVVAGEGVVFEADDGLPDLS